LAGFSRYKALFYVVIALSAALLGDWMDTMKQGADILPPAAHKNCSVNSIYDADRHSGGQPIRLGKFLYDCQVKQIGNSVNFHPNPL
jgi:hypothetical protein